jgi:hypothetical protein
LTDCGLRIGLRSHIGVPVPAPNRQSTLVNPSIDNRQCVNRQSAIVIAEIVNLQSSIDNETIPANPRARI